MQITGTHINYYYVCKRELWFFSHGLQMEHTSDIVYIGKLIDENSYNREEKGIDIDGVINIDWIDTKKGLVHEVKKSDSVEKAHEMQVLYYLYYLKQKGVKLASDKSYINGRADGLYGEIDYPLLKQKTVVILTSEKEKEVEDTIQKIKNIITQEYAPVRKDKKFCKSCSYFELCWI